MAKGLELEQNPRKTGLSVACSGALGRVLRIISRRGFAEDAARTNPLEESKMVR